MIKNAIFHNFMKCCNLLVYCRGTSQSYQITGTGTGVNRSVNNRWTE